MANDSGLSACIITFNEADRIEACLRSVDFCDEIIVVDSHSTDRTRELAAALGARVIERDWPGYRSQKQFAVDTARYDWVLCLDADERVSPVLREEIIAQVRKIPDWQGRFIIPVPEPVLLDRHGNPERADG